ncbi:MAG TPA: histidine kinase [Prolixibacteraceae bacterium]|nr:histidine kinase [Prolixibacteraceae bacterium]
MAKQLRQDISEYFFLGTLIALLLLLNAFDKYEPGLQWHHVVFLLNYAAAAILINYVLIPQYYYKHRFGFFILYFLVVVAGVVLIEEFVLERLLFPGTRRAEIILLARAMFSALPPLLFLVGYKFAWDAVHKQHKIDALKRMMAESELQFLSSQINPHFLFNNLNNIYAYALENSPKTPELILQLSSIMRYMLYDCREKTVLLKKEIENLKNYVQLSELQLGEEGKVNFNVEGTAGSFKVAPLILIVFVENAFKHSTASQISDIQINILTKIEGNTLYFQCENNYTESSNNENISNGIGLKNVKGRLGLIYPGKYNLNIETKNNWYKVFLKIDLTDD